MSPTGAQEEMEEVQTDLRKKEEEVINASGNLIVLLKANFVARETKHSC